MNSHVNRQLNELPVGTWRLDLKKTTITVTATKLGFFTVPGTLTATDGTIQVDADHEITAVEVIAAAGSYASRNDKRNDHVRSVDFLDAENHSDLVFRAGSVTQASGGYRTDGLVTVKGETSPLRVDISDVELSADHGSFKARATVDRNAVGVDKLPSFIVGREIQLTVDAHVDLIGADA